MIKCSKLARKYSLHNGKFVWNIRILVIRVCFVFRASIFVSIYFGGAKELRPGPKNQVFKGEIKTVNG